MALTLTNADIVSRLKLLADRHMKADSGSTTTAVNSKLIDETTVANQFICFVNGNNEGVDRVITSFTDTTGTITFDALDNAVTNTDEFCIVEKGFQSDISQAYKVMQNDLRNMGYDIDLFLTKAQLKEMHIYKTIELICSSLMNNGDDQDAYFVHKGDFRNLYEIERNNMLADYDADESGDISTSEEEQSFRQAYVVR
jgi:hypothetical protein